MTQADATKTIAGRTEEYIASYPWDETGAPSDPDGATIVNSKALTPPESICREKVPRSWRAQL